MAKTIAASVGWMGGINRSADVRIVQELNKVPAASGGPPEKLVVDGVCSNGTCDANQRFQARHFGMSLADRRVDPGGPTLKKLNEYDSPVPRATKFVGTITGFEGNVRVIDLNTSAERPASIGQALTNLTGVMLRDDLNSLTIRFAGGIEQCFTGQGFFVFPPG